VAILGPGFPFLPHFPSNTTVTTVRGHHIASGSKPFCCILIFTPCWPQHKLEVSGQLHAPGERVPDTHWKGAGLAWTIRRRENSWPYGDSNSDSSVVQPEAIRYTD
jgi:hypothetical protein